eukprot:UN18568
MKIPEFEKMGMKELKKYLKDRNVKCNGWLQKEDYIEKCIESVDIPIHKPDIKVGGVNVEGADATFDRFEPEKSEEERKRDLDELLKQFGT